MNFCIGKHPLLAQFASLVPTVAFIKQDKNFPRHTHPILLHKFYIIKFQKSKIDFSIDFKKLNFLSFE